MNIGRWAVSSMRGLMVGLGVVLLFSTTSQLVNADSTVAIYGRDYPVSSAYPTLAYHKSPKSHRFEHHKRQYKHKHEKRYKPRRHHSRHHHQHGHSHPHRWHKHRTRHIDGYWPDYHRHGYRHKVYKQRHYYYNRRGFFFPGLGFIKHGHRHGEHCPDWHHDVLLTGAVLGIILNDLSD